MALLVFTLGSFAQASETFDIATFTPPAGWKKQVKPGVVIYNISNENKGTYALIMLFQSGDSSKDAKSDFETDWLNLVGGPFGIKKRPEIQPAKNADGWTIISGGSQFENELGPAAVILNTFSGYGKKFSSASVVNSTDDIPAIEAFFGSIKLRRPEPGVATSLPVDEASAAIVGTWSAGASGGQRYDDYKNPYSVNGYGYSKAQYTFNSNGTYAFVSKTFRMTFDKILLVKERGTYQVSGDRITIAPQTSVIEAWSKGGGTDRWGKLLTAQNRALEKVTYQFTKHYFSGIQIWNLVLQSQKPTERDGPFSSNTTFTNAWYYAPISPNNTAIELPR